MSTWGASWGTSWASSWDRSPEPPEPAQFGGGVAAYRRQMEETKQLRRQSELDVLMMIYVTLKAIDD
jgi:hypothetical protein